MANYKFHKDLAVAKKTEQNIADILTERGYEVVGFNDDKRYDLEILNEGKRVLAEVKEDFKCRETGNVALEYECRGKPSGIMATKAAVFIYKIWMSESDYELHIIPVRKLKQQISEREYVRKVVGGDWGSNTKMYLFRHRDFIKHSMKVAI